MTAATQTIEGIDCAWLGSDDAGCVAIFFTGGAGPIPESSFIGEANQYEIEEHVLLMSKIAECRLHINYPSPDDFIAMAERGFYAFDWSDLHRTTAKEKKAYELVGEPSQPLTVADLPEDLKAIASTTQIKGVRFAKTHTSGVHL